MPAPTIQILTYFPGTKATIFLETVDGYGVLADGYTQPIVERIVFPDLSLANGFPENMVKLDTGLYFFQFTLPVNAIAVGSYLVDVQYEDPADNINKHVFYQIIVTAPFGNYGITVPSIS